MSSACILILSFPTDHPQAHMLQLAPAGPLVKRPPSMEDKGCQVSMINLNTLTSGSGYTSGSMCKNGFSTTDIVTKQPLRVDQFILIKENLGMLK